MVARHRAARQLWGAPVAATLLSVAPVLATTKKGPHKVACLI